MRRGVWWLVVWMAGCSQNGGAANTGGSGTDAAFSLPPDGGMEDGGAVDSGNPDTDAGPCLASVMTDTDPNNCGACGHVCPHVRNTLAGCEEGVCTYACAPTFADCDQDLAMPTTNGCEVALREDPEHCGRCEVACPSGGANTVAACAAGVCKLECVDTYADCNGDITVPSGSNGCEVALLTSNTHCGECGNACSATCEAGVCPGQRNPCASLSGFFPDPRLEPFAMATDGSSVVVARRQAGRLMVGRLSPRGAWVNAWVDRGAAFSGSGMELVWDGSTWWVVMWQMGTSPVLTVVHLSAGLEPLGEAVTTPLPAGTAGGTARFGHGTLLMLTYGSTSGRVAHWPVTAAAPSPWQTIPDVTARPVLARVDEGWLVVWLVPSERDNRLNDVRQVLVDVAGNVGTSITTDLRRFGLGVANPFLASTGADATLYAGHDTLYPWGADGPLMRNEFDHPSGFELGAGFPLALGGTAQSAWLLDTPQQSADMPVELRARKVTLEGMQPPISLAVRPPTYVAPRILPTQEGTLFFWSRKTQPDLTLLHEMVFLTAAGDLVETCPE